MEFYEPSDDDSGEIGSEYVLHNAAEVGDLDLLKNILEKKLHPPEIAVVDPDVPPFYPMPHYDGPDINLRDDDGCTAIHIAILNGQLDALRILLEAGARITSKCEGSPVLHMAVCVGTHPEHRSFTIPAIQLLVQYGAVALDRDDHGRTPLHWASVSGLDDVARVLLDCAKQFAAEQEEQQQQQGDASAVSDPLPALWEFQDKQGNTALHLSARYCKPSIVHMLLSEIAASNPDSVPASIKQRNKAGFNVLHMAGLGGDVDVITAIKKACSPSFSALASATTRQGLTAADVATKRGHVEAAAQLLAGTKAPPAAAAASPTAASTNPLHHHTNNHHHLHPPGHHRSQHTLLLAPPECLDHHTAPWPMLRGGPDPPPENVHRLTVLTKPGIGILRTIDFDGALRWDDRSRRLAALGDILRVHDWAYVRTIQGACEKIPDDPSDIGHLDGDTAVSRRTFRAALAAAGATTHAVDELMAGKARNAFCAVRPPGHHAGPHGVVTCANDPHGSHGFCLFNNAAIGAAYAMTVYRHAGVKRVAILDFDVHHGNGTEACVANTAPSLAKFAFTTPYGDGMQQFPVYKPWHDVDDNENIFFASVQGYGPKMAGMNAYVYPGSGSTCDTRAVAAEVEEVDDDDAGETALHAVDEMKVDAPPTAAEQLKSTTPAAPNQSNHHHHPSTPDYIEEDPDHEFVYDGGEVPRTEGPRIIDVGIPGPGAKVALWRRSWRDKILPALVKFDPDMIFISAGFDAHKKDEINFAYIGIQEKEYEWLTDQIVQVANRCCNGRVVSVLEGGYRIQGRVVSAFARSVAAHVKALAEPNGQSWDPRDARWEREHEKQLRAEAEAKKAAAEAERLAAFERARAEAAAAAAAVDVGVVNGEDPIVDVKVVEEDVGMAISAPAVPEEGEDDGGRRKRRRNSVDYVALNKKLEEEEAK